MSVSALVLVMESNDCELGVPNNTHMFALDLSQSFRPGKEALITARMPVEWGKDFDDPKLCLDVSAAFSGRK